MALHIHRTATEQKLQALTHYVQHAATVLVIQPCSAKQPCMRLGVVCDHLCT